MGDKKMSDKFDVYFYGAAAGATGYGALENLLENAGARTAALQSQLANIPELTEKAYQSAVETVNGLTFGDTYTGIISAVVSGLSLGICIYSACKEKKE